MDDGDRVDDVVRRVNQSLVRADDRAAVEQAVVQTLTESPLYRFAWVARPDPATGVVEPVAHAGGAADYLEEVVVSGDPDEPRGQGPGGESFRTGEVVVSDVADDPSFEPWREEALARGFRTVAAVPLLASGEVLGLLGVYSDRPDAFTGGERQQLAEIGANVGHAVAAHEHERELERYRMLVETVGDPMYVLDADGHIEMANEALADQIGRPLEDVLGDHVGSFMPEEDVQRGTELLLELIDDPDRRWASFEMTVDRAGGERIRCEDRVAALTDGDGDLAGSVGVVRDVTERVRERERLRDLTERIERLHGVATELQSATDPEAVYRRAVDAGEEILGFDWCVLAVAKDGRLALAAVSDGAPLEAGEHLGSADGGLAGRAFETGETELTDDARADAISDPVHESMVASVAVPLGDVGVFQAAAAERGYFDGHDVELAELLAAHVTEALGRIERDRVLRERERELARQNERLEQFASAISHDLRNPLNLADGHLHLAREALADAPAVDDHLGEVAWALDRMDHLIDEVLTLARQGQAPEDTAPVDLDAVVRDAWATAGDDDAELVVASSLGTVEAERDRLQRLLENLFRNTVEHAGSAPRVVVGPTQGGFYVADDGPGIPLEERERVFESGYTTAEDGSGFGLAIVRELAAAHGWAVSVHESEAGGARFELSGVDMVDP